MWLVFGTMVLASCGGKEDSEKGDEATPTEDGSDDRDLDLDGYSAASGDCDDSNGEINPGAEEIVGDEIDNDCDGEVDETDEGGVDVEDCEGTVITVYIDYDYDGYGSDRFEREACLTDSGAIVDADGEALDGWVDDTTDCDDTEPTVNPGADEICDDMDNDCDEAVDEDVKQYFYRDVDGDGFGDPLDAAERCDAGDGYADNDLDCDDTNAAVRPGAAELCDGFDNNCVDGIDEGFPSVLFSDLDGDGYGDPSSPVEAYCDAEDAVADDTDCDDTNPDVNPGATEVCTGFGEEPLDEDCSGAIDDVDDIEPSLAYLDLDGDGYGRESFTLLVETGCSAPSGYVFPESEAGPFDCDDDDETSYPGAAELCDGADNDCDILIDEPSTLYSDLDMDGFGDPATEAFISPCSGSDGLVGVGGDCDDSDPTVYPGAEEVYDCVDNDCDLMIDEGFGGDTYADLDGDGYGDPLSPVTECGGSIEGVADMTDCDDTDASVHPGAVEVCDGLDNDCDTVIDEGLTEESYLDLDGDGYGDPSSPIIGCDGSGGGVADMTDCDDTDASVHPGSEELCDGIDNDCDLAIDESEECLSTCGDGILDPGEELDPPDSVFSTVDVDPVTCRWDFSEVEQLFCNSGCSWAGAFGCDEADADVFCKLRTGNPLSEAETYTIESARSAPGFPCPSGYPSVYTDRGVSGTVYYTDLDLLVTHGTGNVITNPICTDP